MSGRFTFAVLVAMIAGVVAIALWQAREPGRSEADAAPEEIQEVAPVPQGSDPVVRAAEELSIPLQAEEPTATGVRDAATDRAQVEQGPDPVVPSNDILPEDTTARANRITPDPTGESPGTQRRQTTIASQPKQTAVDSSRSSGPGSATTGSTTYLTGQSARGSSTPAPPAASPPQPPVIDTAISGSSRHGVAPPEFANPKTAAPKQEPTSIPHVRMIPSSAQVEVGDTVSVALEIGGASDVGHVPLHVVFDPQVLSFEFGEESFFLSSDGNQTAFFANPASRGDSVVIGLSRLGRVAGVNGGGQLCVLHFTAVGSGNANLGFYRAKVRSSSNQILPSVFEPAMVVVR